jgi:ribosomal protein S18 acetylase RimI-like enzyme
MSTNAQTDELIHIAGAPDIPGLRFRKFRGEVDFPGMARAFNASLHADGGERISTVESLSKTYSNLLHSDTSKDLVLIEADGELIGYKRVLWEVELDGTRLYTHFGFLAPEWRGKGIGTALVRHSEARLREIASAHPDTGARLFSSWASGDSSTIQDVLKNEGYAPVRYGYDMVRPDLENIPVVPMPEGLETRPVRTEDLRLIWEAEVEAFRDHWGAIEPDEGDFVRWQNDTPFQPEYWQVAWDVATNEPAGMVRTFIDEDQNREFNRKRGYTENISVRRPYRRRSLARALMARSFQLQKDLGMTETALSVDAQNPNGALQLYENMGFRVTQTETSYRKPMV